MTEHVLPLAFGLIFTAVGLAFAVSAISDWRAFRRERATAVPTEGVVISVERITNPNAETATGRYTFLPWFRFVGPDGNLRERSAALDHRTYDFPVGTSLGILYDAASDTVHIAGSNAMLTRSFVAGVFGVGSLVVGLAVLVAVTSQMLA